MKIVHDFDLLHIYSDHLSKMWGGECPHLLIYHFLQMMSLWCKTRHHR